MSGNLDLVLFDEFENFLEDFAHGEITHENGTCSRLSQIETGKRQGALPKALKVTLEEAIAREE